MPADLPLRPVLLRWMVGGEWRAHPGRVIVAALAIAIGVALGYAVHLVNRSALDEFARAVQSVSGEADLQVHATQAAGFDEALYPKLARLPGIAHASPVVEVQATLPDRSQITLLGLDVFRAAQVTPGLIGRPAGNPGQGLRDMALGEDAIYLSQSALLASKTPFGQPLTLSTAKGHYAARLAGTLPGLGPNRRVAVMDIATAQWRFGTPGRLQRIDLALRPGVSLARLEDDIRKVLPPDAELVTPKSEARRSDSLSRAYRVNLEMLAMVALLTGGFLVYSAQSLSVARRRSQFALLRVLGLSQRGLLTQILLEGFAVGVIGALGGLLLGLGLATAALQLLGGDLGGGFFAGSRPELSFDPLATGVFLGLGLAVAMAGSLWPALEAGKVQPAVALKTSGDTVDPRHRPSLVWPMILLGAGGLAALAPPILDLPLFGYGAMALTLAGGIGAMPWLARTLLSPLNRLNNLLPAPYLAIRRLWGAPGQAAVALCGIVASTSLMVAMAIMVSSFRGSVDDWLVQLLPSDVYLRVAGAETGGLDPTAQARLAALPGLARIQFRRSLTLRLSHDQPPITLIATPIDRQNPGRSLTLVRKARAPTGSQVPVWVSEPMSRLYHVKSGDTFVLPLGGKTHRVFVAGVWRDYSRPFGAVAMDAVAYTRMTGDTGRSEAAIDLKPGVAAAGVLPVLRAALPADLADRTDLALPKDLRRMALTIFDRSFAMTYALEAIAILVGMAGVAATFSAQTLARTREFGMLRHIGVTRGQVLAMLALEGGLLGAVGSLAGLALGAVMGQILIQVINPQSFNWTMDTRWPFTLFGLLVAALITAAAGTAVLAGRSALSGDAIRSVREDW